MADLAETRRALHAVAELVLAGPQYRRSGTIRLRVAGAGLATVREPALAVDPEGLRYGDAVVPLDGATCRALAAVAGVDAEAPGIYPDGSGVGPDDVLAADRAALARLLGALRAGDEALRSLAPGEEPVVWPEHLDVAVTVDAVNYGVSPGDATHESPYAYVGPHEPRTGPFWTEPFGASRPLAPGDGADEVLAFLEEGRRALG